ncbi:MAG: SO2930 family diheme c-type cytochrome [Erythrobacter sp.]
MMRGAFLTLVAGALALMGCSVETDDPADEAVTMGPQVAPNFIAQGNPETLAEWGQLQHIGSALVLGEAVQPYDLNTPLFTDYAHKLRTIWMPGGTAAQYTEGEVLDFPVGTVITKTFYYPTAEGADEGEVLRDTSNDFFAGDTLRLDNIRLIETRVLVRRDAGWEVIPYRWNDAQTEASLNRIGGIIPLSMVSDEGAADFNYVMPNVNECASCHATNSNEDAIHPIGPKARHLNRDFVYKAGTQNQISNLTDAGFLKGAPDDLTAAPKNANWTDVKAPLDLRARAYLDINCSHCHSPVGPADTSGLSLEPDASGAALGKCKLPIAAGAGTGNRRWGIRPGHPDDSILVYRMQSDEADKMMPEIGRTTVHKEGAALIADWVAAMDGDCT